VWAVRPFSQGRARTMNDNARVKAVEESTPDVPAAQPAT
jgi:hypothetical protein